PIELVDPKHVFHIELAAEPTQAIFDPGRIQLAARKIDKPEPMWLAELAGATLAVDRAAAAQAVARRGGPAAEKALAVALEKDKFWGVRGAAALALAQIRTETARDRLIKQLKAEVNPKARRVIARALGDFVFDAAAGAALAQVVHKTDASYFVEAEACLALGKTRTPRAGELLRTAAGRDSFMDVIGDPAAIGALRRMVDRELDGRLRRRGKEVIRDLEEGAPLADDVRRLRDEVGELRTLAGALRERLEVLEAKPAAKAKPRRRR